MNKVKNSPDFAGIDEQTAMADLRDRIRNYERVCPSTSVRGMCVYNVDVCMQLPRFWLCLSPGKGRAATETQ